MRFFVLSLLVPLVFSQAAPMQDIALNAKVSASSHHQEYTPEKVVDGVVDNDSRWISASGAGPHTLTIEFGKPAGIGCVQLLSGWAPEGRWIYPVQTFRFEARTNGQWAAIPGADAEDNQRHGWEVRLKDVLSADAIRLVAMDQEFVRVAEVRVFAFSASGDYPDVVPPAKPDVRTGTLCVSGIYPHLASFNHNGECGIGAVVPWADRLWFLTYPPHAPQGSSDKLYEVSPDMSMTVRPESVGGTHANRMIHRESNQLIMGPYFIDPERNVRVANLHELKGRMTATTRHLFDPTNKVYFYDMEGPLYEVDVHSLAVKKLFHKPVPGWHGKGAYVGQGRLVIANNGESHVGGYDLDHLLADEPPKSREDAGVLAEWDGKTWDIVERRQFTDITGPGGIYGSPDDKAPVWAMGWDKRSVMLKVLADGKWSTYRVPKGSYAFDPKHGWYTEWPRIREVFPGQFLMVMHGTLFDFPKSFAPGYTGGLHPVATHLRYIPDFCGWNGKLVLAADDTSAMKNPLAGQSQSNLWFGTMDALNHFGPKVGFGGVWVHDAVKANTPSDPLLVAGYGSFCLHLRNESDQAVQLTIEGDRDGTGQWSEVWRLDLPAHGYLPSVLTERLVGAWVRLRSNRDATLTAYAHLGAPVDRPEDKAFAALATETPRSIALLRPSGYNRNLQVLSRTVQADGSLTDWRYQEVDEKLASHGVDNPERAADMAKVEAIKPFVQRDDISLYVTRKGQRYRLPSVLPNQTDPAGPARDLREVQSERYLLNAGGLFYEMPRDDGVPRLRPICAHRRRIYDFCTWRGLLAISGCHSDAKPDGQYFGDGKGTGLWFGAVDDLWRLGKPVGRGYVWRNTKLAANAVSDPFLATGFDRKSMTLQHDSPAEQTFVLECDFLSTGDWVPVCEVSVPAGQPLTRDLSSGFAAHWLRLRAEQDCTVTAEFIYQ
jgi:hypothetical protein